MRYWHGGPIFTDRWKRGPLWEHDGPVFVAVSDFYYRRWRDLRAIANAGTALRRTWPSRDGAIGLLQWTQPLAKRTGSLSVWRVEDDLMVFLRSPEHTATMRQWRAHMGGDSVRWNSAAFSPAEVWETTAQLLNERLGDPTDLNTRALGRP